MHARSTRFNLSLRPFNNLHISSLSEEVSKIGVERSRWKSFWRDLFIMSA
jgi:hypothetical protein